ncbi:MAG: manganese efflux pump MntP family protein [Clostridiales bacterium]|nr:manganese efflux pump MntP family protein [Clostridiales bacterium]
MSIIELLLIAIGLAADAFAVSVCKGLASGKPSKGLVFSAGGFFGFFQALMPFIGYLLGKTFAGVIEAYDHWVAFALLLLIGANMIREALFKKEEKATSTYRFGEMTVLAIATSIDALAAGVSFACLEFEFIWLVVSVLVIGVITFILSCVGVAIGATIGNKGGKVASIIGGVILILIGVKILLQHLGVINF